MRFRTAAFEACWRRENRGFQRGLTRIAQGCSLTVVHRLRRYAADARVPVLGVVPSEERLAVGAGVLDLAKFEWLLGQNSALSARSGSYLQPE